MNVGLVLSGGMAKGAYQVGALKALTEYLPLSEVKHISCASVGVLNGYAYATGTVDRAEAMWRDLCGEDTRYLISQVLKSAILQRNIRALYDPAKTLAADFYCALLNMNQKAMVYKNLASVKSQQIPAYLKASVAMPIYNKAVKIGSTAYYDGAMVDNIPVYPLLKHNLDYIVCIYFDDTCYKFENTYFDNKIIKITFPCDTVLRQSLWFKRDSIEAMMEDGYERAVSILRTVFARGHEDLDYIYHSIEFLNKNCQNKSLRITGDVLVTNLNKVTQRFAKRKIVL